MAGSYGSTDDKSMDLLHESIRVNEESQLVGAVVALLRRACEMPPNRRFWV